MFLFIGIFILPVFWGLYIAFFRYNPLMSNHPFVGLSNFRAVWADQRFWVSFKNNLIIVVMCVPANIILSLFIALLINRVSRFKTFFRVAYFIPTIISMVCVSLIWVFIYNPGSGVLNTFLRSIGLQGKSWLGDRSLVLKSIAAPIVWQGLGYSVIIFLAGLQGIPQVYYEAAVIDGTGKWSAFRHITLPLLTPALLFVTVTTTIRVSQVFTSVLVMTRGGPGISSLVVVLYMYRNAFEYLKMGYASAIVFTFFSVILILTVLQLKVFKKRWEYG